MSPSGISALARYGKDGVGCSRRKSASATMIICFSAAQDVVKAESNRRRATNETALLLGYAFDSVPLFFFSFYRIAVIDISSPFGYPQILSFHHSIYFNKILLKNKK